MTVDELQQQAHATAVEKGWYDQDRPPLELLMLVTTEVAECAEEWRRPDLDRAAIVEELADVVIRVADAAGHWGMDLQAAIVEKMARNRTREPRHGGKRF
jgi:NTP pyrophosphatase (non-canonical NTP hydrolase)